MTKKEYTRIKEAYLKHKKWLDEKKETYTEDKEKIKNPNISKKEKLYADRRILIYELFAQLVQEAEDNGLHLVTRNNK